MDEPSHYISLRELDPLMEQSVIKSRVNELNIDVSLNQLTRN